MKKKLTFLALTLVLILSVCATTVFATTETASLKITAANLSLENAVYMNFKVTHENIDRDDVKLLVWEEMPEAYTKGTEDTCLSAKTDKDGNTFFHYTDLTAKDMTKLIYACAYAKIDGVEYYSAPIKYSIAIYAHRMKASSTDAELLELIDAMLEYGALAQKYFNHNTDILATAPLYQISVNGGKLEDGFAIGWYHEGATATLTANEADEGYIFSHWENRIGKYMGETKTLDVIINGAQTYTAVYAKKYSAGLEYTLSSDKTYYSVTGIGTCEDKKISIPPEYDGKPVKKVENESFRNRTNIASIIIPKGVISIGDYAFSSCCDLVNITLPEGITSIGDHAFSSCDSLVSIAIPEGITSIGDHAFSSCKKLANITIPKSVTSIGNYAFSYCTSLVSIAIPECVTSIGDGAFYSCDNLENITIPKSITLIDFQAFDYCENLKATYYLGTAQEWSKITIDSYNNFGSVHYYSETPPTTVGKYWRYVNNVPTAWEIQYSEGLSYTLSTDKTYYIISDGGGCYDDNIRIPLEYKGKPVKEIGRFAFDDGTGIHSITIPESVTLIGDGAFYGCINLVNITIPESVTSIGEDAFFRCKKLANITIPKSVTSIGNHAFYYCTSLVSITIPEGVTSIGDGAFSKCSSLASITIPETVESIGDFAFFDCTNLVNITIPNGVTSIGRQTFYNCTSLASITIPKGVTSIGERAFYECSNLQTIFYNGTAEEWSAITIDENNNTPLKNATIYYYSEIAPTTEGNFWHYVDGVPTPW